MVLGKPFPRFRQDFSTYAWDRTSACQARGEKGIKAAPALVSKPMSTEPLVQEIQRAFPERPFTIELWDGSKLPFPDGSFDMVISNNLLHRVVDPSVVLKEIQRVARPEGAILVRDVRRLPSFWMELLLPLYCRRYKPTLKRLAEGAFRAALSWNELLATREIRPDMAAARGRRVRSMNGC